MQGVIELWHELSHQSAKFADSCPGWQAAVDLLAPMSKAPLAAAAEDSSAVAGFSDMLEKAVSSILIWAQGAQLHEASGLCHFPLLSGAHARFCFTACVWRVTIQIASYD